MSKARVRLHRTGFGHRGQSRAADLVIQDSTSAGDGVQPFFRDALASGGALVAVDRKSGRVIGSSRFHGYDPESSEVEIGWTFLARSQWGGVYNGEMKRLMLHHAFRFVDSVVFLVGQQNLRSRRAVEEIGGIRAGLRPDATGNPSVVYRITASSAPQP